MEQLDWLDARCAMAACHGGQGEPVGDEAEAGLARGDQYWVDLEVH
jgi:hypothetical protein